MSGAPEARSPRDAEVGFVTTPSTVGGFRLWRMEGGPGSGMRLRHTVPHTNDEQDAVQVFVTGRFERTAIGGEGAPAELTYGPGDTNDKIGFRHPGLYLLRCVEGPGLFFCIKALDGAQKPRRERIEAQGEAVLPRGALAIILEGAFAARVGLSLSPEEWGPGRVLHAESGDVTLVGSGRFDRLSVIG